MKNDRKKSIKTFWIITRIILISIIVILVGLSIFHRFKHIFDMKYLAKNGYYNPISVGDYSMTVIKFGNENGKGKIVVLSGMGAGLSVDLRSMVKELEADYQFIYIGRPGWDASDDIKEDRNVEMIVEEYRKALTASGSEGPFILMAHSICIILGK